MSITLHAEKTGEPSRRHLWRQFEQWRTATIPFQLKEKGVGTLSPQPKLVTKNTLAIWRSAMAWMSWCLGVLTGLPLLPKGGVLLLVLKSQVGGKKSLLYSRCWPLWRHGWQTSVQRPIIPHLTDAAEPPCGVSWRCSKLSKSSHKKKLGRFAKIGHT